jgi:hypothetical protein
MEMTWRQMVISETIGRSISGLVEVYSVSAQAQEECAQAEAERTARHEARQDELVKSELDIKKHAQALQMIQTGCQGHAGDKSTKQI